MIKITTPDFQSVQEEIAKAREVIDEAASPLEALTALYGDKLEVPA